MRLIDADALCEGLVSNHPVVIYAKSEPTVDAVPVVRCKDCKHLFEDNKCPLRTWWTHTEDDFCSYAERRTDETD